MPSSRRHHDGVRRSERPRHDLYASLNENFLDTLCHGEEIRKSDRPEDPPRRRSDRYYTRTCRSKRIVDDSDDDQSNDDQDDDYDEYVKPSRNLRHSQRRNDLDSSRNSERSPRKTRSSGKVSINEDGDENREPKEPTLSPVKKPTGRRAASTSPEEEDAATAPARRQRRAAQEGSTELNSTPDGDEEEEKASNGDEEDESHSNNNSDDQADEGDDDDSQDRRRYPLRTTRSAKKDKKEQEDSVLKSARPMRKCREKPISKRPADRMRTSSSRFTSFKRNVRRRIVSTSSSSSESDRGVVDKEIFDPAEADMIEAIRSERRAAKKGGKKTKNTEIFMPMNMTEDDLAVRSKNITAERLRQAGSSSCTGVDPMVIDRSIGFENVGGLDTHVQSLKEMVLFPLLYPEVYQKFNIQPPKGVVFYGPPGTGKTLVARALANECSRGDVKVAFFMRKGADCLSKWVGESERQLRHLFSQAYAMRPSIIFFDEIDGLAPVRSSKQDQIHSSIVSTLLALMDGLDNRGEVVVIGATNRLDAIDPALRRPGRFDREMRFSLPDEMARRAILDINVSKWQNPPDEEMMKWLAKKTAGYCGADIKSLCSEAVLAAMRSQYPHIYLSNEKLEIDPKAITVSQDSFNNAFVKITPASRRDLTVPSRQITDRLVPILQPQVDKVLEAIPQGFKLSNTLQNRYSDKLERIVRSAEHIPAVPSAKILVNWKSGTERGQTDFILPTVVNTLDHLTVIALTPSQLFSQTNPEEALHTAIQSALRTAGSGTPCLVLIPALDRLLTSTSFTFVAMLQSALRSLDFVSSVMVVASIETTYDELTKEIQDLFPPSTLVTLEDPSYEQRSKYFNNLILNPVKVEPFEFIAENYPKPKVVERTVAVRKLSEKEIENLTSEYKNKLIHMRIYFRDCLGRLMRDRRFQDFIDPVDPEDAPDYYNIITNPLCLRQMMQKIDENVYCQPEDFLKDIELIRFNAIEYNPAKTSDGLKIIHSAHALMDMVEALFEVELKASFVGRLKTCKKLIEESKNENTTEFTPAAAESNSPNVKTEAESSPGQNGEVQVNGIRSAIKRRGSDVERSAKKVCIISDTDDEVAPVSTPQPAPVRSLVFNEDKVQLLIEKALELCVPLSIKQLECLADQIENIHDNYRNNWDRTNLPEDMENTIESFVKEAFL